LLIFPCWRSESLGKGGLEETGYFGLLADEENISTFTQQILGGSLVSSGRAYVSTYRSVGIGGDCRKKLGPEAARKLSPKKRHGI